MSNNVLLENYLKRLKLPTIAQNYEKMAQEAKQNQASYPDYLSCLTEQEIKVRDNNAQKKRLKQANFPTIKTLDTFNFSIIPSLDKKVILDLYKGNYLSAAENIVFLGSIGTGKTHLSIALGAQACLMGKRVKFSTTAGVINELIDAQEQRKLSRLQTHLSKIDLLILDELGMVPYDKDGANMLFQVLSSRHEIRSTIITTNLEFKDWSQVFGSHQLTAALLDRFTHRCHIVEVNGESFRFKESLRKRKKQPDYS